MPDYALFRQAIMTGNTEAFERLRGQRGLPWVDPTGGEKMADHQQPSWLFDRWLGSPRFNFDVTESYWAAICRDLPFSAYGSSEIAAEAAKELGSIDRDNVHGGLFRPGWTASSSDFYVSQFLLKDIPFGPQRVRQLYPCPVEGNDFLTSAESWHQCQDGVNRQVESNYIENSRHIYNGRTLAEYVRYDFTYQPYLCAALLIQSWSREALNPGIRRGPASVAFVDNGWPDVLGLIGQVSRLALKDCWYWKWRAFRRIRPEELGGRLLNDWQSTRTRDILSPIAKTKAVELCRARNGSALLPQAYPEGSPLHPSFPSGHAAIAGACVTVLKAYTDPNFSIPSPVRSVDGIRLVPFDRALSLDVELNKLAWNISFGRTFAGIHYRSDAEAGLLMGERLAIDVLKQQKHDRLAGQADLTFRRLNGRWITL